MFIAGERLGRGTCGKRDTPLHEAPHGVADVRAMALPSLASANGTPWNRTGGVRLVASITVEAVRDLGLAEGSEIVAVIKVSDVIGGLCQLRPPGSLR